MNTWDFSVLKEDGTILCEGFDYETEDAAYSAAMSYIKENDVTDYLIDVSQPDAA